MTRIETSFDPRPYQSKIMRAFFIDGKRRILVVAHRRSGKDTMSFQMLWIAAMQRKGLYFHLLPKISQSTTVIWSGRGKDGTTFLDYIPAKLVKKVNHSTQSITLINGSIIKITGADNFEALIGSNPLGIVFSEIQSTDPRAWDYLRPVLAENDGFAIFIGTPRGHNHLYDMYQQNKNNESWHVSMLSALDTTLKDGRPVITNEIIQEEIAAGMPEDLVKQEFFCSFEAAIQGAYFSKQMHEIRTKDQIKEFNLDLNLLVFTAWDLGISDAMAIGFFQVDPSGNVYCFEHIEESGEGLEYYIDKLRHIKEQYNFKKYGVHFVPHDIRVRELGTGRTRFEIMQRAGMNLSIVPSTSIQERIQCARTLLPSTFFHPRCKQLIRCLDEFKAKRDDKKGVSTGPDHNWASHSADMYTYFATGYMASYDPSRMAKVTQYAKLYPLS